MKLIHVTDIHLTANKTNIAGLNPFQNFKQCLDHIVEHNADADRMIVTGDLAHKGHIDAYQQLDALLYEFPIATDLVIGNHDDRNNFFCVFPNAFRDENNYVQGIKNTKAGRFIYLDSVEGQEDEIRKSHAGFYDKQRFDWLEKALNDAQAEQIQTCLFMHHHPRDVFVTPCDAIGFQSQQGFRQLLKRYQDTVKYIFFGHCHLPISGTIAGIPFASLRGTNHQVIPDFGEDKNFKIAALSPSYNVVFFDQNDVVIHTIDYAFNGSYSEVGTTWKEWEVVG